jgi:two-component system, NtrC family, nitrogen regulation response regulator NtrX
MLPRQIEDVVPTATVDAIHTLIVDDDPHVRESLRDVLEHEGFVTLEAGDGKTALVLLDEERVDVLLLDLQLPRVSGMDVLRQLADRHIDIPVVIISGRGSIPTAVRSIKLGAYDFLEKPLDAERTLAVVRGAIEQFTRNRAHLRTRDYALDRYGMCGAGAAMQAVFAAMEKAAATHAKVLITGESGTGKEMVASAIHRLGPRASAPLVAVNCAAVPENLIESELFGHVEGAFTGARRAHRGSVEQAHGGTLFLDEIGDMSLMTQAKVLRTIETGELRRVGGEGVRRVDFRLITATNKDLPAEVQDGNFREDLYFRVGVITIHVPPLRRRADDIPDLARHFVLLHARRNQLPARTITPAAVSLMVEYDWPGNVRELSNIMERMVVMADRPVIDASDVRSALAFGAAGAMTPALVGLRPARERFERDYILGTLAAFGWRIQDTADALGINRSHLWKKMKRLGIEEREGV